MNLKSAATELFKSGKRQASEMSVPQESENEQTSQFSFGLFGLVTSLLVGSVAAINWAIDPLWYSHGNILTGKNFAFNERITKTNLFLRTKDLADYDCIILGSSRVTALRVSEFTDSNCFNYALKGGEIPDFVNYANFIKDEGVEPKIVYVGVDGLNFVEKDKTEAQSVVVKNLQTKSPLEAYLSADVLLFSTMTLLGVSPDPGGYYDRNFEPVDFTNLPSYNPDFYPPASLQRCDLSSVEAFKRLQEFFPNAQFIGYVPPRSAWSMVNDTYGRGLMDCYLTAFYQLSQSYDAMYDFSIPSEVTRNPSLTFDGSHYSVAVNNRIAKILQGETGESFGVRIDPYSFDEYRKIYRQKLRDFLAANDRLDLWSDRTEVSIDFVK